MDLFPDGGFVRLQSREKKGTYLHADGDWRRVTLRPNPNGGDAPSLNAVWRVEHRPHQGLTFVLLQSAAYGRYLSFSIDDAPPGHRGRRTTQADRSEPNPLVQNAYPWMWTVARLNAPDQGYVSLRYFNCYLRANGKHVSGNVDVTADAVPDAPRISTMMHWTVRQVAASPVPNMLGVLQDDWNGDIFAFTLCMRPGSHGRLIPLVADLPHSLDSVCIVVLRTGSPAAEALVYPYPGAAAA